jgi:hypothetical protein
VQAIFRSCYALLFFGVPNRGLEVSSLRSMVKGQPNQSLIETLDPKSPFLALLHELFRDKFDFKDSKIISVFETKESKTVEVSDPV